MNSDGAPSVQPSRKEARPGSERASAAKLLGGARKLVACSRALPPLIYSIVGQGGNKVCSVVVFVLAASVACRRASPLEARVIDRLK